jgi:hypothetical protein
MLFTSHNKNVHRAYCVDRSIDSEMSGRHFCLRILVAGYETCATAICIWLQYLGLVLRVPTIGKTCISKDAKSLYHRCHCLTLVLPPHGYRFWLCLDHIGEDVFLFDGLAPYLYLVIYTGTASTAASPVWSIVSMYTGGRETHQPHPTAHSRALLTS